MIVTEDTVFWFGKYKDELVADVMHKNPKYILWCIETIKDFELDTLMNNELEMSLDAMYCHDGYDSDDYFGLSEYDVYD